MTQKILHLFLLLFFVQVSLCFSAERECKKTFTYIGGVVAYSAVMSTNVVTAHLRTMTTLWEYQYLARRYRNSRSRNHDRIANDLLKSMQELRLKWLTKELPTLGLYWGLVALRYLVPQSGLEGWEFYDAVAELEPRDPSKEPVVFLNTFRKSDSIHAIAAKKGRELSLQGKATVKGVSSARAFLKALVNIHRKNGPISYGIINGHGATDQSGNVHGIVIGDELLTYGQLKFLVEKKKWYRHFRTMRQMALEFGNRKRAKQADSEMKASLTNSLFDSEDLEYLFNHSLFAKNSRIIFDNCYLGKGEGGEEFGRRFGQLFQPNGGVQYSSRVCVFNFRPDSPLVRIGLRKNWIGTMAVPGFSLVPDLWGHFKHGDPVRSMRDSNNPILRQVIEPVTEE